MFVIEKPSFTIQMHPVHKLFGLLMVLAMISHIVLNYRQLLKYIKKKSVLAFGSILIVLLILLYGAAINNKIPADIATQMDALAAKVENERDGGR